MIPPYEVIIYWSKADKAFIAEVPELPGCMADGRTYELALNKVRTVIKEWLDTARSLGRRIPAPKGRLLQRSDRGEDLFCVSGTRGRVGPKARPDHVL